jgi:hypothetical protein
MLIGGIRSSLDERFKIFRAVSMENMYFEMSYVVVSHIGTNISEEYSASIFKVE